MYCYLIYYSRFGYHSLFVSGLQDFQIFQEFKVYTVSVLVFRIFQDFSGLHRFSFRSFSNAIGCLEHPDSGCFKLSEFESMLVSVFDYQG